MQWNRIYAIIIRNWYGTIRSYDRLVDSFYWITIDLVLWGITGQYVSTVAPEARNLFFMIVASVLLWNVTYRGQADLAVSLLDELWNKNLVNLFASPLRAPEWIVSLMLFGIVKATVAISYGSVVAILLYHFHVLVLSWYLPVYFVLLLFSGWWIGFLVSALILRFTTKIQSLAWTFVWVLSPFSAIFFPLSALPHWVQATARFVPMSYVFEEMRRQIAGEEVRPESLTIALWLNLAYIVVTAFLFSLSLKRVFRRGLVKVY